MFEHFIAADRPPRVFAKGDIKYVILDLLRDKPSHGYEIMHSLEERFHGFYSPSAGSVYPTLQLLEDMGYVAASEQDSKKVYTISPAGRAFLDERQETVMRIREHMRRWWRENDREELHEVLHELGHMVNHLGHKTRRLDAGKIGQIKAIIVEACRAIEDIINE